MRRTVIGPALALVFASWAIAGPARAQSLIQTTSDLTPPEHLVFGHMLTGGTGFMMTPHAFVPPTSLFGTGSILLVDDVNEDVSSIPLVGGGVTLAKFLEVGGMVNMEDVDRYWAFAKMQLLRQNGIFPAMAVGVQNLTAADSLGRYGMSDPFRTERFRDITSIYGVFTYVAGPGGTNFPSWVMISGGWGSGMFLQDVAALSPDGHSGGLFGALALDFQAAEKAFIRVMIEHDGFDTNAGVLAYLAGLEVAVGMLSIDEGETPDPLVEGQPFDPTRTGVGFIYNQSKPFISVSLDLRALGEFPWIWESR